MCHLVPVLKPMSDFELEFNDRLQYWHRLQGEVVRIMKKKFSRSVAFKTSNY